MNEFQDFLDRYLTAYMAWRASSDVTEGKKNAYYGINDWNTLRIEAEAAGIEEFLVAMRHFSYSRGYEHGFQNCKDLMEGK